jgi:4-hydroxybenzoate polyprenyltransferase
VAALLNSASASPVLAESDATRLPLCVELDGALILSNSLLESILLLIKSNPLYLFVVPLWILRGRAVLSAEVALRVTLNPAALPYNQDFIRWLESERNGGRSLWLCTAADELLARRIAAHLALFDGVLASNRSLYFTGETKSSRLVELFGDHGFDYCGSEPRDALVWKRARGAIVVRGWSGLEREAARHANVLQTFPRRPHTPKNFARVLRLHQWAKNVLVFVPLLAAHLLDRPAVLLQGLLAFVVFGFCASSAYVLNDLLDLEADRAHPRKFRRPFAAGELSLASGLLLSPGMLGIAALLAHVLPLRFRIAVGLYYTLTLAYSFFLKGIVLTDTLTLAGLYAIRIVAGAFAVGVPLSFWLLLFAIFLFLSLAFLKRFAELDGLRRQERMHAAGRGYTVEDLPILASLGGAAGYASVLVLALYINSPEIQELYSRPKVVWVLCLLMLWWISRAWLVAQRGRMHDDPVVFALKDRTSLAVGALAAATVALAI